MSILILNGSPKAGTSTCNTDIYIGHFIQEMKTKPEVKCIAKENLEELAEYVKTFDTLLLVMPLYIHAMPGMVMKFIEYMEPAVTQGKSIGFVLQAGFTETAQEKFAEAYFRELAGLLNYKYLGTVSKGEAAMTYMMPKQFKKVFKQFELLGSKFEETGNFDKELVKEIGEPYTLSKGQLVKFKILEIIGLTKIGWNMMLKQNGGYKQRFDRPFE